MVWILPNYQSLSPILYVIDDAGIVLKNNLAILQELLSIINPECCCAVEELEHRSHLHQPQWSERITQPRRDILDTETSLDIIALN